MSKWICHSDEDVEIILETLKAYVELGMVSKKSKHAQRLIEKFSQPKKRITISSAKDKGRNLQQWVCRRISQLIGVEYNQSDDNCLIHSREMGQAGTDIILRGFAGKEFPFAIECKSSEGMSLQAFIIQAQANRKDADIDWMVVYKCKAFTSPVVIIDWEAFEHLFVRSRSDKGITK